ncbi:Protein NO VEIN C-terminal domain-containing protein [Methylorubrum aminovorans]
MPLDLYSDYSRRQVHDHFDPGSPFTPGTGTWGIHGIVRVHQRPGDFALFVTFGKREGNHWFDESINDEGILRWQSEPRQDLNSPKIVQLIRHDNRQNTVHLFLRTASMRDGVACPFTYLGPLKYAGHDRDRAEPAHVAWELLAWPIPANVLNRMNLALVREAADFAAEIDGNGPCLIEEAPPVGTMPIGENTRKFQARKVRYQSSEESSALGLAGEVLVVQRERASLIAAGREDLAARVEHVSVSRGDGAGYDVASFFTDGRPKFIEVKTTTASKYTDFYISPNEVSFSELHPDSFELCRIFEYDKQSGTAKFYSVTGNMRTGLSLAHTQYRARPLLVQNTAQAV